MPIKHTLYKIGLFSIKRALPNPFSKTLHIPTPNIHKAAIFSATLKRKTRTAISLRRFVLIAIFQHNGTRNKCVTGLIYGTDPDTPVSYT